MFACAEVEIAVGSRKIRSTDKDDSKPEMPSTAQKKSSFATDEWLAQCEAAKKVAVQPVTSEHDKVSSSQDFVLNTASDSGFTEQTTGPKWTTSNWQECHISPRDRQSSAEKAEQTELNTTSKCSFTETKLKSSDQHERRHISPSDRHSSAAEVEKSELYKHRCRSRSPLNSRIPAAETRTSHRRSHSSRSEVEKLRQLEAEVERQSERYSSSRLFFAESTRASAKHLSTYVSEEKSSTRHHRSYDRELPLSVSTNSTMHQVPFKSALQHPASSPNPVESYSTKYGTERVVREYHQQIARNIDFTLSQMKNTAK